MKDVKLQLALYLGLATIFILLHLSVIIHIYLFLFISIIGILPLTIIVYFITWKPSVFLVKKITTLIDDLKKDENNG